jgi:PEP-CTERM motif
MKLISILAGAALSVGAAGLATAATVSVSAFSGPWSQTANPTLDYGVHDNSAPTVLSLLPSATSITITYDSGLTSAFGGVPPSVDALGYVGSIFGSGVGMSGIGSSGDPFPSFFIDPSNTGSPIYLNALIGAFTNISGLVIGSPFACNAINACDGSVSILIPAGATELSLGVNDDIFADNSGALTLTVTGVSAAPEPSTWAMMLLGFAGLSFAGYRRTKASASVVAAA